MTTNQHIQQTLILFKPDALQRGIVGEILARFERVGLKIVAMKMICPTSEQFHFHYETIGKVISRKGEAVYNRVINSMQEGPVIAAVLEGVEAVEITRKLVGATEPKSAAVGTIRGDYCHISYGRADAEDKIVSNLVHASADLDDANKEIQHWFSNSELYDYQVTHEKFTQ